MSLHIQRQIVRDAPVGAAVAYSRSHGVARRYGTDLQLLDHDLMPYWNRRRRPPMGYLPRVLRLFRGAATRPGGIVLLGSYHVWPRLRVRAEHTAAYYLSHGTYEDRIASLDVYASGQWPGWLAVLRAGITDRDPRVRQEASALLAVFARGGVAASRGAGQEHS